MLFGLGSFLYAQNPTDACGAGVQTLTSNGACAPTAYNLPGSYTNGGVVNASCVAGNDRDDGWYRFVATGTITTIEVTGDQARTIAVFTGSCGTGELGCDSQVAGTTASVSVPTTIGVTYYIQVHRRSGNGTASMAGTVCVYGGAPASNHNLGTGNLNACAGTLFDSGGGATAYGNSENITETYCSNVAGQCITINFNSFNTESCCDHLNIYDGPNTASPLLGTFNGTNSPGSISSVSGTCLTFEWTSDGSVTAAGWDATISCAACPTCSDGILNGQEVGVDCGGPSCPACPCGALPVSNDEACCATAVTVNPDRNCGSITPGTIAGATASFNATTCAGTDDDDVWFSFVATNTTHFIDLLNVAGSTTDLYHAVYAGTCNATGASLVCSDPNNSSVSGLTIGNTYYIRVYSWTSTGGQTSTFDVCVGTPGPPPPNDESCSATPLTVNPDAACGSVTFGTVAGATASSNATTCGGTDDDDVWFSFVATNTTHYIDLLNVAGSTTDLYHAVYGGPCNNTGASLLCSDPNNSTISGLTIGNTYYVRVYTWTATAGQSTTFNVCVGTPPPPPTNDSPCSAIPASVNSDAICNSTTYGYTVGGTQTLAGCVGTANDDVWFSFVALSTNQDISILNATGTTDLVHELFSGSCASLTSIGCSDPDNSSYTGLTVGATYFVRVYTYSSVGSNTGFDLCITSPCGLASQPPNCGMNYAHSMIPYSPVNYNLGTQIAFIDDRLAPAFTSIGFDFCFDGTTYADCMISSNGYITFPGCYSQQAGTNVAPNASSGWTINAAAPNSTNAPTNSIMGPWQDINPSIAGSEVKTVTVGTAPNRIFVAIFKTVGMFSCTTDDFQGQIMLYETSNNIEIHIGEKTICSGWNSGAAILGLNGWDGTQGVIPAGYNYPTQWSVPTSSPEAHRFSSGCTNCTILLAAELSKFDGETETEGNRLSWTTASEKDLSHFVVERSIDGRSFIELGRVNAVGTSTEVNHYQYFDADNQSELVYYRLRQVEMDGKIAYSKIISLSRGTIQGTVVNVFPNPTTDAVVNVAVIGNDVVKEILVNNYLGQQLQVKANYSNPKNIQLDVAALAPGTYMVEVVFNSSKSVFKKLIIN